MSTRVMVAMSGGVDSSVAAAILRNQGYDVVGIAMRLAPDSDPAIPARRSTCCSHDDFEDARRVAEKLDFPFYVIDLRAEFARRVIGNFVSEYLNGRTPNPCVRCNLEIKFDRLWERARAIEADFVATGHYARILRDDEDIFRLARAHDLTKDQSYFLFTLRQAELARTLFPLGSMTKLQVRDYARRLGLRNADKAESQEICFVRDNDYARFIANQAASAAGCGGNIIDESGRILGTHRGIHHFTVGQRRGIGLAASEAWYVREIRAGTAEVVVTRRDGLASRGLIANDVRFVAPHGPGDSPLRVEAKIRYRHPALEATLTMIAPDRAEVRFASHGPAVSPGQACVFYRQDEVLGGGFIERAL
ncbi:MAG: tRNA 2-thiouridine(34) synthase MnmA [Candidatus Binataceae bacterium]|nr:tRNA 2-thiouridine(34) synthase MnmA [Candidatus Binataceae bacterium]